MPALTESNSKWILIFMAWTFVLKERHIWDSYVRRDIDVEFWKIFKGPQE